MRTRRGTRTPRTTQRRCLQANVLALVALSPQGRSGCRASYRDCCSCCTRATPHRWPHSGHREPGTRRVPSGHSVRMKRSRPGPRLARRAANSSYGACVLRRRRFWPCPSTLAVCGVLRAGHREALGTLCRILRVRVGIGALDGIVDRTARKGLSGLGV